MSALLLSLAVLMHNGWERAKPRVMHFCEKHLIADDPYQFENTETQWLIEEYARVCAMTNKTKWARYKRVLERELRRRGVSLGGEG